MAARLTTDAVESEVPAPKAGWWSQHMSDQGAHFGSQQSDGTVLGLCGARFTPLDPGFGVAAMGHSRPADPEHACRKCRRQHPRD